MEECYLKSSTLLKEYSSMGVFLRFLNGTIGTKSNKTSPQ